jgi:ABC-2 type transport system ATP-binding protein
MLLTTQNLSKQFDRHLALDGVNLQLRSGDVYGLIGPNGAGKTTLLRLLALADEPTTGEIYFDGARLRAQNPEQKRRLGWLPDDYPLYNDLTVWNYLDYMARLYFWVDPARSARIHAVLAQVQLESKRDALIGTLSRGMKQRLGLAQAILHQPDLLLMDEPVSGLDPLARSQFRTIVKELQAGGMTIVISSHILSDLENFCTAVGVMEQGKLVESAALSELYDRLSTQHVVVAVLDGADGLQPTEGQRLHAFLSNHPQVSQVKPIGNLSCQIEFAGSDADRAQLLQSLLAAQIPVTDFHSTQENLESIFLKMDYQRTS